MTAALSHRFGYLETPGFMAVLAVVAGIAMLALLLAVFAFSRLWSHGDIGGRNITVAVVVSLVVLTPFAFWTYWAVTLPMLFDVSTDLDDPPSFVLATAARGAGMNPIGPFTDETRAMILQSYPLVTGRRYEMPYARVAEAVAKVLQERSWTIATPVSTLLGDGEATVEAVARTLVFALPADVAVRLTDEGESTYVDMRSVSRFGRHDLGDNAARVASFLADLDAEIAALVGVVPAEPAEDEAPIPEPKPSG